MTSNEVAKFVEDFKSAIDGAEFPAHTYGKDYSALGGDAKLVIIGEVEKIADGADNVEDVIFEVKTFIENDSFYIASDVSFKAGSVYAADLLDFFASRPAECEAVYSDGYVLGDHASVVEAAKVAATLAMENEAREAVEEYLDNILECFNELVDNEYS